MSSDYALLEAWRSGDSAAGSALFERHYPAVAAFFRNKVGDAFEDLVQQTFMACVEGRDRLAENGSFRSYMFACARNKVHDHVRRLSGPRGRVDFGVTSVCDVGPSVSSVLARRADQGHLLQALRSLPVDDQILLELYYWEQSSGPELAEILELSEGGVRSRLRRAKERLVKLLEQPTNREPVSAVGAAKIDEWAAALRGLVYGQISGPVARGDARVGAALGSKSGQ